MNECPRESTLARRFSAPALLRFALPTMLMMLLMGLYTTTDTVFVARFAGTDALAALNIVCPVMNLTVGLATMLAAGGNAVIARRLGAGETRRAGEGLSLLTLAGAALGTLIAGAGFACMENLLRALGARGALAAHGRAYLGAWLPFAPACVLQTLFASFFVTAGRPGLGSAVSVLAGALNIALDALFMARLGLGISGAALGTGLGYLAAAGAGAAFFVRGGGETPFRRPRADGALLRESCANGASEMVSQSAAALTTFLFNRVMLRLAGAQGVAAMTILIYAQFLLTTLYIGFSMGVAPVIGYRHGARDAAGLRCVTALSLRVVALSCAGVFTLTLAGGEWLVSLFAPQGAVHALAAGGLRMFSVSFLFCGVNIFASALFTARSMGGVSAALSFLRTFVLLAPAIVLLPRALGVAGVFLAVPLAELLACGASAYCLVKYRP